MNFVEFSGLGKVGSDQVIVGGRHIRVSNFPMGIDYDKFSSSSRLPNVKAMASDYSKKYKHQKIIASVDRLDPSKGLVERLKAYRQYLKDNPKSLGKVVFVMVAAPSRTDISDYQELSSQLSKLAASINKQFGNKNWKPVDYINEPVPFESVTALFQIADVAFIAPLKDGMNLAAKEFVASNKKGGVLILSATAGAAEELQDAIIVDPNQPDALVGALNQALRMRKRELRRRLKKMRHHLSTHTVQDWAKTFMDALNQPVPGTPHITYNLNDRLRRKLIKNYVSASKRLLLLDYDGSLVPFTNDYSEVKPPKELISLLRQLSKQPSNEVVLISGRKASELEKWFGKLKINLVAEHGAAFRIVGTDWTSSDHDSSSWQKILLPTLEKYSALTPGSSIEIKPNSLVWHYRNASSYYAQKYAVVLKRALRSDLKKRGLELVQGNKILEIKNPNITKGKAIERWLAVPYGFILAIGDDTTDEDLFSVLPANAYSIKIGKGLTAAQYRVESTKQVIRLLKHLV
jgi:trehalose 6-phosphate synthase/phosphatase